MFHLLSSAVLLWSIIYVIPSITCTVIVHGVSLKFQPTPFHPQATAAEHVSDSHSVSQPEKEESHRARRPVNYLPLGSASTDHRGRQPPPLHHGGAGVHTNLIRESLEENYFQGEDDYKAVSSTDETLLKDRSDHMTINKNSQKTYNQNDQATPLQQNTRKTGESFHTKNSLDENEEHYYHSKDDDGVDSRTGGKLLKDKSGSLNSKNAQKAFADNDQEESSTLRRPTREFEENLYTNIVLQDNVVRRDTKAANLSEDSRKFCPDQSEIIGSLTGSEEPLEDQDVIDCFPCTCIHVSSDRSWANCTYKSLLYIPHTLPQSIYFINMSHNIITRFNTSTVMLYPELVTLDLNHNKIRRIYKSSGQTSSAKHSSLKFLNLNLNKVAYIEDGAFSSFSYLISLQMSWNLIRNITKNIFKGLSRLCRIDLSHNYIKHIDDDAFADFLLLEELFMNFQNKRTYTSRTLKPRIFRNLINLKTFKIQSFFHEGGVHYPNEVLDQLTNLQELSVDGHVGILFSRPSTNLHTLRFDHDAKCHFKNLTQETFRNAPNLRHLFFSGCLFKDIDFDAFAHNTKLETFSLHHVGSYDLYKALKNLHILPSRSVRSLSLIHLYSEDECRVLSAEHGKYLQHFVLLEKLDLSDNGISLLRGDFLDKLPRSLKYFVLNENRFDMSGNLWYRMHFLDNLKELHMNYQNVNWRSQIKPKTSPHQSREINRSKVHKERAHLLDYSWHIGDYIDHRPETNDHAYDVSDAKSEALTLNCSDCDLHKRKASRSSVGRKRGLPPNLKTVTASMYIGFGEYILYSPVETQFYMLQNLSFPFAFMSSWGRGRLPPTIMHADFSYNPCSYLSHRFFPKNNSLLSLNIRHNFFGVQFSEDSEGKLLSGLNKLRHLDISSNSIFSLPGDFLKGLSNLVTLDLSNNKLRVLNLTLSHLKKVSTINFGQNAIHHITKETMDHLDEIGSRHYLAVNFKDNSIPCTCEGIDILQWMSKTRVVLMNRFFLTCISAKGKVIQIGDIQKRVESLQRECINIVNFSLILSLSGTIILLVFISGLVYRNRWRLRYMKNRTLATWLGFKPKGSAIPHFKFDAYIVYHHEDIDFVVDSLVEELEKKRGHKVCIEDRDFIPGTFNTNNIICAIQNSTVTLLLATPASLASGDVEYAVQMAALEEYYSQSKRPVLQVLFYQDTDEKAFSTNLLAILSKGRYLEYPKDDNESLSNEVMQGFWDRLSEVIGHTSNSENRPRLCVDC